METITEEVIGRKVKKKKSKKEVGVFDVVKEILPKAEDPIKNQNLYMLIEDSFTLRSYGLFAGDLIILDKEKTFQNSNKVYRFIYYKPKRSQRKDFKTNYVLMFSSVVPYNPKKHSKIKKQLKKLIRRRIDSGAI